MRRQHFVLLATCSLLAFGQCNPGKKVTYNIPADYPPARRDQVIAIFEKGKLLYKENCSDCHGIFTKGKDKVPNFSNTQFDNYSARFMAGDPKNHAVVRKMSTEQLNQVLTFMRYKRPLTDSASKKKQ